MRNFSFSAGASQVMEDRHMTMSGGSLSLPATQLGRHSSPQ